MKKYILLFLVFLALSSRSQNRYYVSASGDDQNNTGTSPGSPWKTIAKVNLMMSTFNPGDSVLFKRGEEFAGELIITRSGTSTAKINFGSYGSGTKAILNGAIPVTGWLPHATNIWVANYSGSLTTLNNFFMDDVSQQIGRWPNSNATNTGYNSVDASVGNTQLTDAPLSGQNFVGGTAVVRVRLFILNKASVISHSGSTLTFSGVGTNYDMTAGDGYFIQNHISTLDQQGEWCFDAANNKIYLYSATDPNTLQTCAPAKSNTLSGTNISHVSITNLKFVNANSYGIKIENSNGIKVENCDFLNTHNAIYLNTIQNSDINYNTINNTNNNAIWIAGSFYNCNYNTINNTALRPGMGEPANNQYNAINMVGADATVMGNRINKVGYCGIRFEGSRLTLKNNVISEFALTKADVGGIYSFKGFAPASYGYGNNLITGNIISNGVPNLYGTRAIPVNTNYAVGIYLDQSTINNTVTNNTVFNCNSAGFMINEGANTHIVRSNVFYNNMFGFAYFPTTTTAKNLTVKNNIWFSKHPSQILGMSQATNLDYMKNFGLLDSNYFAQPFEPDSTFIQTNENYATRINRIYSLYDWKKLGYDLNSVLSNYKVSPFTVTATGSNTITNSTFNSGISGWTLTPSSGTLVPTWDNTGVLDGGSLKLSTAGATGPNTSRAAATIGNVEFNKFYQVSFSIKGSTDTARLKVTVFAGQPVAKYRYVKTSTQRNEVTLIFSPVASINNVSLQLTLNDPGNLVWIDNVQFKALTTTNTSADEYLFFAVNDEASSKTFNLGSTSYKDVKGNTFSGSITLPPYSSTVLIKNNVVLPLRMTSFSRYSEGCNANLSWTTEDTRSVRGFELERSADGKRFSKFSLIEIQPSGSYNQLVNQGGKEAYYRLKIVDVDGSSRYSNIIRIKSLCQENALRVAPNPVKTEAVVVIPASMGTLVSYKIVNAGGQVVLEKQVNLPKDSFLLNLDTALLKPGYYVVSVQEKGKSSHAISFIKE
ncbi:right-handed parallel beta-helix repeat-containing protein [Desertivirga arenae]|uniref:right-handed parallel beta-helix repeat-containing protein n=1 Tax=Desertivirga arenae TaxID=2810309 RepID=UPI001A9683DD|nr:right-handed parallel beta-helix repeat-containing protein [Pedobacter sp. SYSU D00823]